jgi:hypothetical protein
MNTVFEELFEESNGLPVEFQGKTICLGYKIEVPKRKVRFKIEIEKVGSEWEQGIFLMGKGVFIVDENEFNKGIYFWQRAIPRVFEFDFFAKGDVLDIWNMWRINAGPMQYGHNGAAMYVENIPGGRRFFCNDGYPDQDFDDLVFTVSADIF